MLGSWGGWGVRPDTATGTNVLVFTEPPPCQTLAIPLSWPCSRVEVFPWKDYVSLCSMNFENRCAGDVSLMFLSLLPSSPFVTGTHRTW